MRTIRGLVAGLALAALVSGPASAAPVAQTDVTIDLQDSSHIIRLAPTSFSAQPSAVGTGTLRTLTDASGNTVAAAMAFTFRDLTPNNNYVVVTRGDLNGDRQD